jgi:hypothetical protein
MERAKMAAPVKGEWLDEVRVRPAVPDLGIRRRWRGDSFQPRRALTAEFAAFTGEPPRTTGDLFP